MSAVLDGPLIMQTPRSEEHTSELQSHVNLVCRLLLEKKNHQELHLQILDYGEGLSGEAAQRAGQPFFTTKTKGQGFGIGLFLANANIERFGGKVRLTNREGGACTQVILPLIQPSI